MLVQLMQSQPPVDLSSPVVPKQNLTTDHGMGEINLSGHAQRDGVSVRGRAGPLPEGLKCPLHADKFCRWPKA
jgi:hypothetical protein